jgi:hypothetical protein
MMTRLRFHHGWASLIGLLFAAAIAFFLYAAYLSFHQNIRPEMTEAREMLDALSDSPAPAVSSLPERGAMESMTDVCNRLKYKEFFHFARPRPWFYFGKKGKNK